MKRIAHLLIGGLILLCVGCKSGNRIAGSTADFSVGTGFTQHQVNVDGKPTNVWIFVPKNYNPRQKYPTILFLHGLFEAGNGSSNCLAAGLGPVIAEHPEQWPFITIFPQSTGTWKGEARERVALGALSYAQAHWSVDRDRVILAGLSYGALGTWQIGARHPDKFAALVPVSGHRATESIEKLIMLPVWAFAFSGDPIVKAQSSEDMCREITERGGRAQLTEFLGVGHDAWKEAVHDSDVVAWMLKQRRNPVYAEPGRARTAVAHID